LNGKVKVIAYAEQDVLKVSLKFRALSKVRSPLICLWQATNGANCQMVAKETNIRKYNKIKTQERAMQTN